MASQKWDAYRSLDIASRGSYGITCFGMTERRTRCTGKVDSYGYKRICELLTEMEKRPPNEAVGSLENLAKLGLCSRYHSRAEDKVIRPIVYQWEKAIEHATYWYGYVIRLNMDIHNLKVDLAEAEANSKALQKAVKEPPAQVQNHISPSDLGAEVEMLPVQLASEHAKSITSTNKLMASTQRCKILDGHIEERRQAPIKLEDKVETLVNEKDEVKVDCNKNLGGEMLEKRIYHMTEELTQLSNEMKKAKEQAEVTHDTLRIENLFLERQLEKEHQKCSDIGAQLNKLKTARRTLQVQAEILRAEFKLEENTSSSLRDKLRAANAHLFNAKIALVEEQERAKTSRHETYEIGALAVEVERELLEEVSRLEEQIKSLKNHPLGTFFTSLVDAFCDGLDGFIGHFLGDRRNVF